MQWDFLVVADAGRPLMAVEVKGRRDADVAYAATWRSYVGQDQSHLATLLVDFERLAPPAPIPSLSGGLEGLSEWVDAAPSTDDGRA